MDQTGMILGAGVISCNGHMWPSIVAERAERTICMHNLFYYLNIYIFFGLFTLEGWWFSAVPQTAQHRTAALYSTDPYTPPCTSLHYIALHYTTLTLTSELHYTTLHCCASHSTALMSTRMWKGCKSVRPRFGGETSVIWYHLTSKVWLLWRL